ncbi:VOC family protein [Mesorhizobium sp. B2-3-4]|uniref:VOC family protein n=1 Tax=Mesorhizobium sp. B2-3-4 TaxID=2589959 RepID=UPI001128A338|nr:VOC family protein [Mesorhizobium sp. B2-3-4]TPM32775.1 bleomycin resistance protein [Mesorhizobium sp. B2-3-4]
MVETEAGYQILGTNHTSFTVSDLDRSVAFFRDCLGFTLTSRAGRDRRIIEIVVGVTGADIEVAYLTGAGHVVELIQYFSPDDRKRVQSRPCDTGFAHLAFDVVNIDALILAAGEHGFQPLASPVKIGSGGPNGGRRVCYMRDHDGVTIELIESPQTAWRPAPNDSTS